MCFAGRIFCFLAVWICGGEGESVNTTSTRNQPCPCGSGRRYKHCHGATIVAPEATTNASPMRDTIRQDRLKTLQLALAQQREGRLASAEALYEEACEALPGHFDAMHMLGVVKLQLGKFEKGTRLLVAALPLAPNEAIANLKHNLALCLLGLARQRGVLETLTANPRASRPPAPFVRAYALPDPAKAPVGRISIVLVDGASASGLQRTLDSVRAQNHANIEIIAAIGTLTPVRSTLQAALDGCGAPSRLIIRDGADTLVGQVNMGADASTGEYLCLLRIGDRWAPRWLQQMTGAMKACGVRWGYGGLRMLAEDGTVARFGSSPAVDALLREQDGLYTHRTASLGFLSFNPIAVGRNLIVRSDLWRHSGGYVADAADPGLDWAWRTARDDEPVYVDEPGYLIPSATAWLHRHAGFARMIASTLKPVPANDSAREWDTGSNPCRQHGLSVFWARQWQQIRAFRASMMPPEILLACAEMLGVTPVDPAMPRSAGHAT